MTGRVGAAHAANLAEALASMRFRVDPEPYVLLRFDPETAASVVAQLAVAPTEGLLQCVLERDAVTVFVPEREESRFAGFTLTGRIEGQRLVTFETPMTWDVVGFLARASSALAEAGVPLGAICGFDRDHLFVHERQLDRAREALRAKVCPENP